MTDLVSRLLAAIDERDTKARAAIAHAGGGTWYVSVKGDGDVRVEDTGSCVALGPYGGGLYDEGPHMVANDPDSVLRLCQAHRDIVARYEHARERSTTAPEAERILWHTRAIALIDVMDALARGYGVEDGETK